MCLAKNIRYLRRKYNYSQEYLAEKLGYKSYTTIQKWEMGVSEPSVATVRQLAELFHVDMNDMTTKDIEKAENSPDSNTYYFNEETQKIAQEIFENRGLHVLFDASRNLSPDDIEAVLTMVNALNKKGSDTNDSDD